MKYKSFLYLQDALDVLFCIVGLMPYHWHICQLAVLAGLLTLKFVLAATFGKCPCCGAKYRNAKIELPPKHRCQVCGKKAVPDPDPGKAPAIASFPGVSAILLILFCIGLLSILGALWQKSQPFFWPVYLLGMALSISSYLLHRWIQLYKPVKPE